MNSHPLVAVANREARLGAAPVMRGRRLVAPHRAAGRGRITVAHARHVWRHSHGASLAEVVRTCARILLRWTVLPEYDVLHRRRDRDSGTCVRGPTHSDNLRGRDQMQIQIWQVLILELFVFCGVDLKVGTRDAVQSAATWCGNCRWAWSIKQPHCTVEPVFRCRPGADHLRATWQARGVEPCRCAPAHQSPRINSCAANCATERT
jgi:hypothetical protein